MKVLSISLCLLLVAPVLAGGGNKEQTKDVVEKEKVRVGVEDITDDAPIQDEVLRERYRKKIEKMKKDIATLNKDEYAFHSDFEKKALNLSTKLGPGEYHQELADLYNKEYPDFNFTEKDFETLKRYFPGYDYKTEVSDLFQRWPKWGAQGSKPVSDSAVFDQDGLDKLVPGALLSSKDFDLHEIRKDFDFIETARYAFNRTHLHSMITVISTSNAKWITPLASFPTYIGNTVTFGQQFRYLGREMSTYKGIPNGQKVWTFYMEEVTTPINDEEATTELK